MPRYDDKQRNTLILRVKYSTLALKMKEIHFFEKSLNIYQSKLRNISEKIDLSTLLRRFVRDE